MFANIASTTVDVESDNSLMSSVAWSDDEGENPPRKRARTQKRTLKSKKAQVQSSDDDTSSDE